jgi:hypothetical protein
VSSTSERTLIVFYLSSYRMASRPVVNYFSEAGGSYSSCLFDRSLEPVPDLSFPPSFSRGLRIPPSSRRPHCPHPIGCRLAGSQYVTFCFGLVWRGAMC